MGNIRPSCGDVNGGRGSACAVVGGIHRKGNTDMSGTDDDLVTLSNQACLNLGPALNGSYFISDII